MKKKELKELLKENNIEFGNSLNKAELLELANDNFLLEKEVKVDDTRDEAHYEEEQPKEEIVKEEETKPSKTKTEVVEDNKEIAIVEYPNGKAKAFYKGITMLGSNKEQAINSMNKYIEEKGL